ncbi:MAG TPA: methyltransferase domain-containing protein [Granulicella sp.]|jgi:SAM-dependent methyltransferase|nr:methyltransferase domain-containing protein [Granulicella sp.]
MRSPFSSSRTPSQHGHGDRESRHSSGWQHLQKFLTSNEGLRILDIGPTSAVNINYVTSLGHSIYMANLVDEAAKPEWKLAAEDDDSPQFDAAKFIDTNLNFQDRKFDVVTFWDTADYLPSQLLQPVLARIYDAMKPGGLMLTFFHAKAIGAEIRFSRYHLTPTNAVEIQRIGNHPLLNTYSNRQIEQLLQAFSGYKFFLAKDNLSEVIATR